MKIKIDVDFELPRWVGRVVPLVFVPAAVFLGARLIARADTVAVPNSFQDGNVLTAQQLNDNFAALAQAMNNPSPDCPKGYTRVTTEPGFPAAAVLCRNGVDDVVKVGDGASAFWADRFEASVWDNFAATSPGQAYGTASDNYPDSFPDTGQWSVKLYAVSKKGVTPSRAITWFQANAACRVSGKRLPTGSEWLAAAMGTPDPGDSNGTGGQCLTGAGAAAARGTGAATTCRSAWGAEDMIGNLAEWTDEWYAGLSDATMSAQPWPATGVSGSYGADGTWGISSKAYSKGDSTLPSGIPSAAMRGGAFNDGVYAGTFALLLTMAPSGWHGTIGGFRCIVPGRQ